MTGEPLRFVFAISRITWVLSAGMTLLLAALCAWLGPGSEPWELGLMLGLSLGLVLVTAVVSELWIRLRAAAREARELTEEMRQDHSSF